MNGRIRDAAMIGLWLCVGATVPVIVAGMAGLFPLRSGWLLAAGVVGAAGCGFVLTRPRDGRAATMKPRTRASAFLTVGAAVLGAALSLLCVLGGPGRALPTIAEMPGRVTGQVHGMWESALLEQDLDELRARLGDRGLQNLYLMGTYYTVDAYALDSDVGVDAYVLRNGDLTLSDKREGWSTSAAFTVDDVDPAAIRKASAQIYADDPDARISLMYLTAENGFTIHVSIDGEYTSTSRVFDGRTGEDLTER